MATGAVLLCPTIRQDDRPTARRHLVTMSLCRYDWFMSEQLLTKPDAAARLGVSERSLERYVKAGRITPTYQTGTDSKGRTSQLACFAESDLITLKDAMNAAALTVKTIDLTPTTRPSTTDNSTADSRQPDNATLAALVALSSSANSPLWLSLRESAMLSGLPLADVRRVVQSGAIASLRTGRGTRLRRDIVLQWAMSPTVRVPIVNPPSRKSSA